MLTIILFTSGIFLFAFFVTVGLLRNDIFEIKTSRIIKKHPYSRKLRVKPPVYVRFQDNPSPQDLNSIKRIKYKKLSTKWEEISDENFIIYLDGSAVLNEYSVQDGMKKLTVDSNRNIVFLQPIITIGTTTYTFLQTYVLLSNLPLYQALAGFNIASTFSLVRPHAKRYAIHLFLILMQLLHMCIVLYVIFLAAIQQPELFILYIASFSVWLTWSIIRYPNLRFYHKILLILISPASFPYFLLVGIKRLFSYMILPTGIRVKLHRYFILKYHQHG